MTDPAALPPSDVPALPASPEPALAPGEWDEDRYLAACTVLVEPETTSSPWVGLGCLLLSLLLFALSFAFGSDLSSLFLLVLVLFFHEAGHFLGMRLFGYRNVRMFFIPFLGAAVSGTKHAAPVWQQAVVLLLGPLPGIVVGLVLQLVCRPTGDDWLGKLVMWLVVLNGFNLLPVVPLDGGRLVDLLLFAHRPMLAVVFRLLAIVALCGLAIWGESWMLGVLALLMLPGTPARYRQARLERAFRHNPLELPERLEEVSDAQRRDLFGWALLLQQHDLTPVGLAAGMRSLHENMVSRRPGLATWSLLLLLYLGGVGTAVAVPWLARQQHREQHPSQEARDGPHLEQFQRLLVSDDFKEARMLAKTSFEQGQLALLRDQLEERFGALSDAALQRLEAMPADRVRELGRALLRASSLAELGLEDTPRTDTNGA